MLTGQVALVTGASGPIGAAIADTLAGAGASVAAQYGSNPPQNTHFSVQADLAKPGFEQGLLASVQSALGPVSLLVNCAADQAMQGFGVIDDAALARMLRVNVSAPLALSRAFVAQVPKTGVITNISSIEAQIPAPGHGHYAASKAALDNLTRSFAVEFGPLGVRCNAVAPGLIHRDGLDRAWPEGVARWQKACPLTRLGRPEDVAQAVLFLSSPNAAWINGSILTVDGGTTAAGGW